MKLSLRVIWKKNIKKVNDVNVKKKLSIIVKK